jgi:hypothetical protein
MVTTTTLSKIGETADKINRMERSLAHAPWGLYPDYAEKGRGVGLVWWERTRRRRIIIIPDTALLQPAVCSLHSVYGLRGIPGACRADKVLFLKLVDGDAVI